MERIGRSRKTKNKNEKIKSSLETLVWNVPGSCIGRKSNKKGEPSTNNVKMYMLGYNSIRSNKRKIALGCMQEISYPNRQKQSHFHVRNIRLVIISKRFCQMAKIQMKMKSVHCMITIKDALNCLYLLDSLPKM